MAKRYKVKAVRTQNPQSNIKRTFRPDLRSLSNIGISWDEDLINKSLLLGINERPTTGYNLSDEESLYKYASISKYNEHVAYFDEAYPERRELLRAFATDALIEDCVETIADECIVYDTAGFYAYPNTDILKSRLKSGEAAEEIIKAIDTAFRHVYYTFNFHVSDDAWHFLKKFLIDGYLAYEIIFDYDKDTAKPTGISGFKEIDPITLTPKIKTYPGGRQDRMWVQYKDTEQQREIPDAGIIYLSWATGGFASRSSYVERLIRSFNALRQLENSRIIWNVQNAQKRVKIEVPVGEQNEDRIRTRLEMFRNYYKEEVNIDTASGEVTYNGSPEFPFAKTYIVPTNARGTTSISELGVDGYDLNSIDQLTYFWDRFVAETKIPRSRMANTVSKGQSSPWLGTDQITRDEYAFARFYNRVRTIFKEILIKPLWIQFSLMLPKYAKNEALRSYVTIKYNEENIFAVAKEREALQTGSNTISSLTGLLGDDGKPYFSSEFLAEKFLGLTEDDKRLNKLYKLKAAKQALEDESAQDNAAAGFGGGFGGDSAFGGGFDGPGDFGGGDDFGGFGGGDVGTPDFTPSDAGGDAGGEEPSDL